MGNTTEGGGSFYNETQFTGAINDKSTGMHYLNARYYNPETGRFISQDSYTGNAYDPWTQNLYAYCGNNPVNFVDPTGHFFEAIGDFFSNAWNEVKNWVNKEIYQPANVRWLTAKKDPSFVNIADYITCGWQKRCMANIKQLATPKYSLNGYVNDIPAAARLGMDMYVPAKIAANAFAKPTIGNIDVGGPSPGEAFKQIESESFATDGSKFELKNGSTLYQIPGWINGKKGRFEWIIYRHKIVHRLFVEGVINGIPIK